MQANLRLTFEHCFECELKQVTPMIHFQANQPGATLRATQVKPMLDRFLCREYTHEHNGADIPAHWRMSKDDATKTALRYKLSILANGEPLRSNERKRLLEGMLRNSNLSAAEKTFINNAISQLPIIPNSLSVPSSFFANMPPKADVEKKVEWILNNTKEILLFPEPLTLQFYCKDNELRRYIQTKLKDFFLLHSFGTRTSKGFGSFVVKGTDDAYAKELYRSRYGAFIYADIPFIDAHNVCKAMNYATGIVQLMKSGINQSSRIDAKNRKKILFKPNNGYEKGHLIHYYQQKNIGSDKCFMKSRNIPLFPRGGQFDTDSPHSRAEKTEPVKKYQFIRALLGLADHIDFRDNMFNDTVKFISPDGSIERFKSPITIRLGAGRIYFLPETYPKNYLGQWFLFLNSAQAEEYKSQTAAGRAQYIESIKNPCLQIPSDFDLKTFLLDFASEYNATILNKIRSFIGSSFIAITSFSKEKLGIEGG